MRFHIKTVGTESSLRLGVTLPGSSHDHKGERVTKATLLTDQELPPILLHTAADVMIAHYGEPPDQKRSSPTTATGAI